MTEHEVQTHGARLIQAIMSNNDVQAKASGAALAVNMLVDLNRIANALSQLAMKGIKS